MNLCRACGLDFAKLAYFDAHRVGVHAYTFREGFDMEPPREDGRRCLDAEELRAMGWTTDARGRWYDPAVRERTLRWAEERKRVAAVTSPRRSSSRALSWTADSDRVRRGGERVIQVEPVVTAREVAEILGVSSDTVLDWWEAGRLPGFKYGGDSSPVRFRVSEILAWLEAHRRGPQPHSFERYERPTPASTVRAVNDTHTED
jgi:excisionase family DNA binding protein